jgi:phosphoribosyl 1,2-cyclic phosphodiesterase
LRFISLASGSKGNGYLVQAGDVTALVDAGLSGREMERRIQQAGLLASRINLLLLTHEHSDHLNSAGLLSRRFKLPVYGTAGTLSTPCGRLKPVREATERVEELPAGETLTIGPLSITPFSISHDAADPVGFVFAANGHRVVLAADLGCVTRLVAQRLAGASAVILESNHCPEMLRHSHYPLWLQRRIAGRFGHLSNADAAGLVRDVHHVGLRYLLLAHLSENNNTPRLAYEATRATLEELGATTDLRVARQGQIGAWIDLDEG